MHNLHILTDFYLILGKEHTRCELGCEFLKMVYNLLNKKGQCKVQLYLDLLHFVWALVRNDSNYTNLFPQKKVVIQINIWSNVGITGKRISYKLLTYDEIFELCSSGSTTKAILLVFDSQLSVVMSTTWMTNHCNKWDNKSIQKKHQPNDKELLPKNLKKNIKNKITVKGFTIMLVFWVWKM